MNQNNCEVNNFLKILIYLLPATGALLALSLFSTGNNSSYRCIARSLFPTVGRLSFPLLATLAYRCIAHSLPLRHASLSASATAALPAVTSSPSRVSLFHCKQFQRHAHRPHISLFHCYLLWLQVYHLLSRTSRFFIAIYSGYRCTARSLFLSVARLSFPLQTTPATCALPTLFLAIAHLVSPLLATGACGVQMRTCLRICT